MTDALRDLRTEELTLPPLQRARSVRIAAGFTTLAFVAFGFIPQFGGPGYESSLAAGLILPATSALCLSFGLAGTRVAPLTAFGRGLSVAFALAALGLESRPLVGAIVGKALYEGALTIDEALAAAQTE